MRGGGNSGIFTHIFLINIGKPFLACNLWHVWHVWNWMVSSPVEPEVYWGMQNSGIPIHFMTSLRQKCHRPHTPQCHF